MRFHRFLTATHKALLRMDSQWQTALNLLLLAALAAAYFNLGDWQGITQGLVIVLAPLLVLANILLARTLKAHRKKQLSKQELQSAFKSFESRERFSEIYSGAVTIHQGVIELSGTIPVFSFMRQAQRRDIETISQINFSAFARSPWSGSTQEKTQRNLAFWERNHRTFWVIDRFDCETGAIRRENGQSQPIFFSSFLPLTEIGFQRYFIDKLAGDNDFRADWIAGPDDAMRCILMFTFARDLAVTREMSKSKNPDFLRFYLRCCGVHLERLLDRQPCLQDAVPVYFQNNDSAFAKLALMAGMDKTTLTSADGESVYTTTIKRSGT